MRVVSNICAQSSLDHGAIQLSWKNPNSGEFAPGRFAGLRIVRRERSHPVGPDDGELVYNGPPVAALLDQSVPDGTFQYYRIYTRDDAGVLHDGPESLAHGFASGNSGSAEHIYTLLPAIHQRFDQPLNAAALATLTQAQRDALAALPEGLAHSGQLRRFVISLFRPFDLVRSSAEALPQLRDVDLAPPDALTALAESLGWELDKTLPLARRRNDVRFAPTILRRNGSVESVVTLIERYSGWRVDLVEKHRRLWRTHTPPRMALRQLVLRNNQWRGANDVAPVLDLPTSEAVGATGVPAVLESVAAQPFRLPRGATLRLEVGVEAPFAVRFEPGDFSDISAATAPEIVAVLAALCPEIVATNLLDGRVRLETATVGPEARLRVIFDRSSPLTVESAAAGRLATVTVGPDNADLLLYEVSDAADTVTRYAAKDQLLGLPPSSPDLPFAPAPRGGAAPTREATIASPARVRFKVRRGGRWHDSLLLATGEGPAARPCATRLGGGSLLVGWLANPFEPGAHVALRTASLDSPTPARLGLGHPGPWSIPSGSRLILRVTHGGGSAHDTGVVFSAADFANPASVMQTELLAVLNIRLNGVIAAPRGDGGVVLLSVDSGSDAAIEIDLTDNASSVATALGLDPAQASSRGSDALDLTLGNAPTPTLPAAGLADPHLAPDGAGGAWLFAVDVSDGRRALLASRLTGAVWSAPDELALNAAEPAARLGSDGLLHLFYAQRDPATPGEDRWTIRRRRFDSGVPGWDAEEAITNQPIVSRAADREPAPGPENAGQFPLFLSSDRAGGRAIHVLSVDLAAPPANEPTAVVADAFNDSAPLPLLAPDGTLELIHRSDAAEPASRPSPLLPANVRPLSRREDRLGIVPHAAGAITVDLSDVARLGLRAEREDLLNYTSQRPISVFGLQRRADGPQITESAPAPSEQFTRETVSAYIRRAAVNAPLTASRQTRLAGVLNRYQPINLRLALTIAPDRIVEDVYDTGRDIEERWEDRGPTVENIGLIVDTFAATAPGLAILVTNSLSHQTADPGNLSSLRNRLFFPPLT